MHTLRIGQDWGSQVAAIRAAHTEDTNLIRFDNTFHRICRADPGTFFITLLPGSGSLAGGLRLAVQVRDLYVTEIDGRRFERYASTLDLLAPQALGLDHAIQELPTATVTRRFELQSLIVFCVAESLRSDLVATKIEQLIRATTTGLRGVPDRLQVPDLLRIARAWGQTSDAIFTTLTPKAKDIVLRARTSLSGEQRQHSERVHLARIDPALRESAMAITVLKRPD